MAMWNRKYEMLQKLGYGEGNAYCMKRKDGGDICACKVVSDIESGRKEAQVMKHLMKHLKSKDKERVVGLKDCFQDKLATYLVMERCKCSLAVAGREGMTEEDAAMIIESLVKAIRAIHSAGVVHRNLNCDNVLITHDDKVKISDFGSATCSHKKSREEVTVTVGSPKMMQPEAQHGSYGKEVDIYSLGVILYRMLENRPAFEGVSEEELKAAILSKEDYPARLLKFDRASKAARELILMMMAVDPKKRIKAKKILEHKWVKMTRNYSDLYKQTVKCKEPFSVVLQGTLNTMSEKQAPVSAQAPVKRRLFASCMGCQS